jgi:competence protein ComEA
MKAGTNEFFPVKWRTVLIMALAAVVFIFSQGSSLAAAPKSQVDINTASQAELEAVKGVGPATAKKIIANRPYKSLDDLSKAGLSGKKIDSFRSSLTVGGSAAPAAPSSAKEEKTTKETRKRGEALPGTKAGAKVMEPGSAAPVDLNTADQKTLEALPGVGPSTAKKIIAARPFTSVEDLSKVKGLSKAKIEALKDKVTVGQGTTAPPMTTPAPAPKAPGVEKPRTAKEPAPSAPVAAPPAAEKAAPAKEPMPSTKPMGEKEKGAAAKLAPGEKVNLNTASKEELDRLPEIGPVKAQAIIDNRPYSKIEDVMKVKGIKQHTFDKIKDNLTVD